MFLTFAGITFQGIKLPKSFDGNYETLYGQIPIIGSKPDVQGTGEKLDEYDITALFHVEFCVPRDEMDALQKVRKAGTVDYLVDGTGKNYGKFVITTLSESKVICLENGYPTAITCQFHLLEYNTIASVINQTGSALLSQNPVPAIAILPLQSTGLSIAENVKNGQVSANKLSALVPTDGSRPSNGMFSKIGSIADKAKSAFSQAVIKIQATNKIINRTKNLTNGTSYLINSIADVTSNLDDIKIASLSVPPDLNRLQNANNNLNTNLILLNNNYAPVAAFIGSREGGE